MGISIHPALSLTISGLEFIGQDGTGFIFKAQPIKLNRVAR